MKELNKNMLQSYSLLMLKIKKIFNKLGSNLFGIFGEQENDEFSQQINNFFSKKDNSTIEEKQQFLKNFISFNNKTADDIMIPRTDIIAIPNTITLAELKSFLVQKPLTRVLVYQENLDNIIGFIHIKDLLKLLMKEQEFDINQLIRKPIIGTHIISLWQLLQEMQEKKIHMAIIIDEYGGLDGIVTLENIISQIVGKIDDEYNASDKNNIYKFITPSVIVASGRMRVDVLESLLSRSFITSEDDIDTVAGLVMKKAGMILPNGDKIKIADDVEVEVLDSNSRTIKTLKITFDHKDERDEIN